MEGIYYVTDEDGNKKFVQIDLEKHGELWEDFLDVLIATSREGEERVSFDLVKEELKKYGNG
jgi:hypothetical protein